MFLFFSATILSFLLKGVDTIRSYFKPQVILNISSLCKKKNRSVKKSAKATSCDISNWDWTAAVSLWDRRWSVIVVRCFVCWSGSLQNSICSLHIFPISCLCAHTHSILVSWWISLCSMPSPTLLFICTSPTQSPSTWRRQSHTWVQVCSK